MTDSLPIGKLATRWLQQDLDPDTRREIEALIAADDGTELERRLRKRIAFGTAGLRSSMKAGYAHMNSLTVLQASQGLADYILAQRHLQGTSGRPSVVIGYDARHNSQKFARLAAGAFLAKGFEVLWFGILVHTPMVPFAVSHFGAAAGVMVTASHNPPADNGYKVYWGNGCQIIPPHDKGIALAIADVENIIEWSETLVEQSTLVQRIYIKTHTAYFDALGKLISESRKDAPRNTADASFTYTPLHGVGLSFMRRALHELKFDANLMYVVEAQAMPDPDFPTVPFPNPEEKGALALACQEAERNGSKIVISNDPDADRFAAAERLEDGRWHQFTGNQMGTLLASCFIETKSYVPGGTTVMLASTVSSRMLAMMGFLRGFTSRETLTGFKWLGNVAQQTAREGLNPVFAFEEAIGYMFPSVVWEKDGVAAAVVFLAGRRKWLADDGLTPYQKLQQLYQHYGYFEDANTYLISPSSEVTQATFAAVRTLNNGVIPTHVGKRRITRWRDLTLGYDTSTADGRPVLPTDPDSQMITCELEDGVVFTARGSGTEPKIKLYIEATAESSAEAKRLANDVLRDLLQEWFEGLRLAGT
ncbi:hypothetical protein LTR91_018285 [Friedmanniomyces endolithicus]|uniref:Phosphoribomutase n=1 Tax=Friedmanniomyces endolithicus TaxID=329885 RepID=A0AAN6HCT0_9PEZI|nr:hypothetical protein LTS09_015993 [Friedmanniomyces endolithicus]KAK0272276.1 hypothetical protein LTS00_016296 [Friedmanniomyces endolithicus]KAK0273741.1 hypothetical protein LTR35_012179 [Friedmanniomyces endolithicus]KAK0909983.1 hypothetical protein LTR57_016062 [Friedmanniomyces endolithicus]KAK0962883.1 hypothetical protein LTS01_019593 [Friedmanniomyces endolithicus]